MPPGIFDIDDDLRAFLERAKLTLATAEDTLLRLQVVLDTVEGAVTQARALLADVQAKGVRIGPNP